MLPWLVQGRLMLSGFLLVWLCCQQAAATGGAAAGGSHWAFQPLRTSPLTAAAAVNRGGSPIDVFIRVQLERHGLHANGPADNHTLVRRASYDLTGLPPTPAEIAGFVDDPGADAYARLIDRLLASPAYGERWGRIWLDLARYADSNGADENMAYPNAWRFRDYVIRSFNEDKPFDRFLREQLAGDLLPPTGMHAADVDRLVATGFLALGPKMLAEQDKEKLLIDVADEQIDVVSKTFMGLTISCARCHDHKFDPITQEDYFALAGIFRSSRTMADTNHVSRWVEALLQGPENPGILAAHERTMADMKSQIVALEANASADKREERLKSLKEELKRIESAGAPLPKAMAVIEGGPTNMPVHIRGNHLRPKPGTTPRGVIRLFEECLPSPVVGGTNSGRMELADWLTDPRHPLTARVMVNRIWQGHFGSGLVRSPSNFGLRGDSPTHPELLDWLAMEFIQNGWSIKHMHRIIMLSDAYRRSSRSDRANANRDPDNLQLWRQNRRRLEAEPIRDALLLVSGKLDPAASRSLGALEKNQGYHRAEAGMFDRATRAVYLPVVRADGYGMFATFDAADPAVHHASRAATIVPSQALFMLNSDLVMNAARDLAVPLARGTPADPGQRLHELFLRLYARPARPEEVRLLAGQVRSSRAGAVDSGTVADWERVCRVLLAANEFVYVN